MSSHLTKKRSKTHYLVFQEEWVWILYTSAVWSKQWKNVLNIQITIKLRWRKQCVMMLYGNKQYKTINIIQNKMKCLTKTKNKWNVLSFSLTWRWLLTCEMVSPFTSIILRTSFGVASVSFKPNKKDNI